MPVWNAWIAIITLFLIVCLAGFAVSGFIGQLTKESISFRHLPILGLSAAVWYAEAWSLFAPVDAKCVNSLIGLSILGSVFAAKNVKIRLGNHRCGICLFVFVFFFFSLLVATNSATAIKGTDPNLYQLNAIRAIEDWGTVPGLANVHGRLGFNCSFFVASALFNGILLGVGTQVVNGIVLVVCAAYVLGCLAEVRFNVRHPALPLIVAALAGLSIQALDWRSSSPTPDVAQSALAICSVVAACEFFILHIQSPRGVLYNYIILLMAIVSLHIRFKLSGFVLGSGLAICGGLGLLSEFEERYLKTSLVALYLLLILLLPWLARGYVTSGYPFYPSTVLGAPVDWKVPEAMAKDEAGWVYAWARNPGPHWTRTMADYEWISPWWKRTSKDPKILGILGFWLLNLVTLTSTLMISFLSGSTEKLLRPWKCLCAFAVFSAFIFWLIVAPAPRFAEGLLWSVGLALLLLGLPTQERRGLVCQHFIYLIFLCAPVLYLAMQEYPRLSSERRAIPAKYESARLVPRRTNYGVIVFVPADSEDYRIGDAPVPSTLSARFQPNLESRGNSLRDGFRINGVPVMDSYDEEKRGFPAPKAAKP
jgi:hypothetical protein